MPPIYRPLSITVRLARALAPLLALLLVVDALLPGAPAAAARSAQRLFTAPDQLPAAPTTAASTADITAPTDLLGSGRGTTSVAVGDLNGDGALDLVLGKSALPLDESSAASLVYLNDGHGGFPASIGLPGSRGISSVAIGDLNGDDALDIVLGNGGYYNSNNQFVSQPSNVYLNNGSGGFPASIDLPGSGRFTTGVALGDLNGDGALDFLLSNRNAASQVFLNDGHGGFGAPTDLSGSGQGTASVALGDLNGDGALDLLLGNAGYYDNNGQYVSQSSQVFLNDRHGGFGAPTALPGSGQGTFSVALGDLNGDGALDLLLGNRSAASQVFLNDGHAGFGAPIVLPGSGQGTFSVALGDLNGDGALDLLLGNYSAASQVFLNDGHAGFGAPTVLPAAGQDTTSVAVGDLNSDGALDLVLGDERVASHVFLNDGHSSFGAPTDLPVSGRLTTSVAVGDLNGDGALDLVLGNQRTASQVFLNDGHAGFGTPSALPGSGGLTTSVAVGDLNGDGALDLVLSNVGTASQMFLNDRHGGFGAPTDLPGSGGLTSSVAVGDLNGDGALDLVLSNANAANQVYLNDGHGGFGAPTELTGNGQATHSVALGDLNGDGTLDLVLGKETTSQVYLNDGHGGFSAPTELTGNGQAIYSVAVGDLNGDGALDLVLGKETASQVYLNDGHGGFGAPSDLNSSGRTTSVAVGDLNGDGALDLVLGHFSTASQVYLNDGHGGLGAPSDLNSSGRGTYSVAVGDLNDDGALDLVLSNVLGASQVYANAVGRSARLPNNRPTVAVARPGSTANANFHSTPALFTGPTITIPYKLADPEGDAVARIRASYSLDDGTSWRPAHAAGGTPTTNLPAAPAGIAYTFTWDIFADGDPSSGFFGQSDDVVFRIQAEPGRSAPNSAAGPFQRPYAASISFPFRVRGTLPQVRRDGVPLAGAVVYQLPSGQVAGALPFTNKQGQSWRTNGQGYLAGRSPITVGDTLFALQPISATDTYSLYFTSAAPNATGLTAPQITVAGVQTLTIAATNPLMLLNLSVALEWDARGDGAFMTRLQTDIQRASALLYDFTDGQVALGAINIYQNRDHWYDQIDQYGNLLPGGKGADIRIHTANHMRPSASQGGISVADRPDPTIAGLTYEFGHVRMGTAWNRDGEPVQKDNDDWARALAHELGHYALFLDDNYLGLDAYRRLIAVDSCPGAMSDPYRADGTEFRPRPGWLPGCAATLANTITRRADWETIKAFYDKDSLGFALRAPETFGANAGPSTLPLAVTQITVVPPAGGATLGTRFIDLLEGTTIYTPTANARVFLFSSDGQRLADLGEPANRQVSLRGAHAGDRLCLYDLSLGRSAELSRTRLGCTTVSATTSALTVGARDDWNPDVLVTLETSRTLMIEVPADGVGAPPPPKLTARLFPVDSNQAPISVDLALAGTSYSGTLQLAAPVIEGAVYVGVPNDSAPVREMVTSYTLGGNPAPPRRPARRTRSRAPLTSSDGQVILYSDGLIFDQQTFFFYSLQTATRLPVAPQDTQIVGPGYRLIASKGASLNGVTIDMSYADSDVPLVWPDAPGFNPENGIAIYYYPRGGTYWQLLPSARDLTHNEVTTPVRGPGLYVLMSRPWQSRLGMVIR